MNADHAAPQKEWVTPSFERQALKDALGGTGFTTADGPVTYS